MFCANFNFQTRPRILLIITGIFMVLGFALLFTYYNVFVRYVFIVLLFIVVIIKRKTILKMAKKILDIRHSAE